MLLCLRSKDADDLEVKKVEQKKKIADSSVVKRSSFIRPLLVASETTKKKDSRAMQCRVFSLPRVLSTLDYGLIGKSYFGIRGTR